MHPTGSPLWQLVHHGWDDFLVRYEKHHRKSLGKLRPYSVTTVQSFLRCGDLAAGFTRLQCPDCGHERLLAPSPISSTTSSGTPRKKQTPSSKIYGYFGIRES
ncbi:MAG: transposase zinc-binding domain-containing protein [Akkermansiaceae bacterium]